MDCRARQDDFVNFIAESSDSRTYYLKQHKIQKFCD